MQTTFRIVNRFNFGSLPFISRSCAFRERWTHELFPKKEKTKFASVVRGSQSISSVRLTIKLKLFQTETKMQRITTIKCGFPKCFSSFNWFTLSAIEPMNISRFANGKCTKLGKFSLTLRAKLIFKLVAVDCIAQIRTRVAQIRLEWKYSSAAEWTKLKNILVMMVVGRWKRTRNKKERNENSKNIISKKKKWDRKMGRSFTQAATKITGQKCFE